MDVGVVHFTPLVTPVIDYPFEMVEKVARCVFHFRQKYCIKGVGWVTVYFNRILLVRPFIISKKLYVFRTLFPKSSRERLGIECLSRAQVPPTSRPFQLTLPEVGRIVRAYDSIVREHPKLYHYNYRLSKEDEFLDTEHSEGGESLASELCASHEGPQHGIRAWIFFLCLRINCIYVIM